MTTQRIQDFDVFAADTPAITIGEADQTWTITAGVLVSAARNNAVFGQLDSQTLFNFGNILGGSPDAAAVNLQGDHSAVTNGVGARIIGVDSGVLADGNTASVDNRGSIDGITGFGAVFGASSSNVTLTNSGAIHGQFEGVGIFSTNGGTIHNAGRIVSEDRAIEVLTAAGQTTVVVNAAKGTIDGAGDAIRVDGGNIVLTNLGTLTGDVEASVLEKDVIVNNGTINGNVFLGGGDDVYSGIGRTSGVISGSGGNDRLTGGAAADFLNGGPDNDLLRGAAGNDRLAGDFGLDTLTGGPGRDRFLFQSPLGPSPTLTGSPISRLGSTRSCSATAFSRTSARTGCWRQRGSTSAPPPPMLPTASSTIRITVSCSTTPTARAAPRRSILLPWPPTSHCIAPISSLPRSSSAPEPDAPPAAARRRSPTGSCRSPKGPMRAVRSASPRPDTMSTAARPPTMAVLGMQAMRVKPAEHDSRAAARSRPTAA